MWRRFLVVLVGVVGFGCGGTPPGGDPPATCAETCAGWEFCDRGTCAVKPGLCVTSADCAPEKPLCVVETHVCVPDPRCDACESWQACVDGACTVPAGKCGDDGDCATGTCDTETHSCGTFSCNPACPDWKVCRASGCALMPGRCDTDKNCSDPMAPTCDLRSHLCVAPDVIRPATSPLEGLIITSDALRPAYEKLAGLHSVTGVPTRVVTLGEICGRSCTDDPRNDVQKALKAFLAAQPSTLRGVVLGGDIEDVPSRLVSDYFANSIYMVEFEEDFYTDYYYADFSEWDVNHDGLYADDTVDRPDLRPELAVTRLPAGSPWLVENYLRKAANYLTKYDLNRVNTAFFVSNVATTITVPLVDFAIPIDSGIYFEMTDRSIDQMPSWMRVTKMYTSLPLPGVEDLTVERQLQEMQRSHNLIVHAGHGWEHGLTLEVTGENQVDGWDAWYMENTQYPIFLSGACSAGTFSYSDSAGEKLVLAPDGGAIAYLGNGATGLGLAGGAQFVDMFLNHTFNTEKPLIGEAFKAAHQRLPDSDWISIPTPYGDFDVHTVDHDSYEWTQKSVTLLGDGLLPVYNDPSIGNAPVVNVTAAHVGGYTTFSVEMPSAYSGVFGLVANGQRYEVPVSNGRVSFAVVGNVGFAQYGFHTFGATLPQYGEISL